MRMSEKPAPVSKLKIKIDEWRRQIYETRGKRVHRCRRSWFVLIRLQIP